MLHPRYFLKKAFPSFAYADLTVYTGDVLDHEPHDPLIRCGLENGIITPYIGSRT
jgi:hypothetical protein